MLQITVLDTPQILLNEQPLPITIQKALALIYYLALERRAVSRQVVVGLLWGEASEAAARRSLRVLLTKIRPILGDYLHTSRRDISLDWTQPIVCDAYQFEAALAADEVDDAVGIYSAELLSSFTLEDANEFTLWLYTQRERLQLLLRTGLHEQLANALEAEGWNSAETAARRLIEADSWDEPAYRGLITALAQSGQAAAAIAEYERCKMVLSEEVGVAPSTETEQLVATIRAAGRDSIAAPAEHLPPPHNLPNATTPFVGRSVELSQVVSQLSQPTARLITLLGPGGIGKTRFSLELARHYVTQDIAKFPDGVFFVPLEAAHTRAQAIQALAYALDFSLNNKADPLAQLCRFLRKAVILIVFDNFEQLTVAATDMLQQLLDEVPALKLIVTSRQRLRLPAEIGLPMVGLPFDDDELTQTALHLFEIRAQRYDLGFQAAEQRKAIRQICQLVEGMPLGIELAAAWSHVMSCQQIADLIASNTHELEDPMRPAKHQTLQAVFNHSWQLLRADEQAALGKTTLFRGGFDAAAAIAICQSSRPTLFSLVEKSLVQRPTPSRYGLHMYVQQSLQQREPPSDDLQQRYMRYYIDWISSRRQAQVEALDRTVSDAIWRELDNLRHAFELALLQREVALITDALPAIGYFWVKHGLFREGYDYCREAIDKLGPQADTKQMVALLSECAGLASRLGNREEALALVEEAFASHKQLENERTVSLLKVQLSIAAFETDDYARAFDLMQAGIAQLEASGETAELSRAYANFYRIAGRTGRQSIAAHAIARSVELARSPYERAHTLNIAGHTSIGAGRYEEAARQFAESIAIWKAHGSDVSMASASVNAGVAAYRSGDLDLAVQYAERCLVVFGRYGELSGVAAAHNLLGDCYREAGRFDKAADAYRESKAVYGEMKQRFGLAIASFGYALVSAETDPTAYPDLAEVIDQLIELGVDGLLASILPEMATLLRRVCPTEISIQLLHAALATPGIEAFSRSRAQSHLAELGAASEPQHPVSIVQAAEQAKACFLAA